MKLWIQKGMLPSGLFLLCVAFAGYGSSAEAAGHQAHNGTVTVVLNEAEASEGSVGNGSAGAVDKDRSPGLPRDDTVSILDPDVPLADLGPLPQTGSGNAALGLVACGFIATAWGYALIQRRPVKEGAPGLSRRIWKSWSTRETK